MTIFITGSTDGIGKATAFALASEGHHLYLHGRNSTKLENTISEIKTQTGNNNINGYTADFSDLKAVENLAQQFNSEVDSLDVLINNAGVFQSSVKKSKDGIDLRIAVNYLAAVALTNKLIPTLRKSNYRRIINLSSAAQTTVSTSAVRGEQLLPVNAGYAQSKLAILMWSFHLAKNNPDLTVIAVNPGSLLNTKMVQEAYGRHFAGVEKGANILEELALLKEHRSNSGLYFDNDQGSYGQAHEDAYNQDKIEELITATNTALTTLS